MGHRQGAVGVGNEAREGDPVRPHCRRVSRSRVSLSRSRPKPGSDGEAPRRAQTPWHRTGVRVGPGIPSCPRRPRGNSSRWSCSSVGTLSIQASGGTATIRPIAAPCSTTTQVRRSHSGQLRAATRRSKRSYKARTRRAHAALDAAHGAFRADRQSAVGLLKDDFDEGTAAVPASGWSGQGRQRVAVIVADNHATRPGGWSGS